MKIKIKALTPSLIPDFLSFFDNKAFEDNPEWAACYCHFFYIPDNETWLKRTAGDNRRDTIARIRENKMQGFLAYFEGKPIGFCNADFKVHYPRLIDQKELWDDEEKLTASVVCFIISHEYRRKGIATGLLKTACDYYKSKKCEIIEGYPRKNVTTDADHYYGPLSMYTNLGFEVFREFEGFYLVKRELK